MNIDDIKKLRNGMPQVWIEGDSFIIESSNFKYEINSENLDILLSLRRTHFFARKRVYLHCNEGNGDAYEGQTG